MSEKLNNNYLLVMNNNKQDFEVFFNKIIYKI